MRLDKYLVEARKGSRKEIQSMIKKGYVTVNGSKSVVAKQQIREDEAKVCLLGQPVFYQKNHYYLLNKPAGVISATEDKSDRTVMDCLSKSDQRDDLFPVGRLDKDTEGLLLLTTDGVLAHQLLSPKKHVDKEYQATIHGIVTEEDVQNFSAGIRLKDDFLCKSASLTILKISEEKGESNISLVIQEGKFHQVKRMFEAVNKKVIYLKRVRMGSLVLDEALGLGEYRPLTQEEILLLKKNKKS